MENEYWDQYYVFFLLISLNLALKFAWKTLDVTKIKVILEKFLDLQKIQIRILREISEEFMSNFAQGTLFEKLKRELTIHEERKKSLLFVVRGVTRSCDIVRIPLVASTIKKILKKLVHFKKSTLKKTVKIFLLRNPSCVFF